MKNFSSGEITPIHRKSGKSYLLIASIFTLLNMANGPVLAQESSSSAQLPSTSAPSSSSSEKKEVERVEVIGTRIKRLNTEGPSAVKSIKKEQMEAAGNINVSDALRDSSAASFGVTREASGGAVTSHIGLRGLGATRTLILLNGQRLPKDPTTEAVDLNLIPQAAIERIEILKDGASALYGSDALGGVINIVTKKNFTGNEITFDETAPQRPGGSQFMTSLVTGSSNDKSDLLVSVNYSRKEQLFGKDREITKKGESPIGTVPVYYDGSTFIVSPNDTCPPEMLKDNPYGPGKACYFRFNEYASVRPLISQLSLLSEYSYRLDSGIKFFNRNLLISKDIAWVYAPPPIDIETPSGTASTPSAREVLYRDIDAGNRDNSVVEKDYSVLFGAKGSLTDIWELSLSTSLSQINRQTFGYNGYLDEDAMTTIINNGTYDPLKAKGSRGDISKALFQPFSQSTTELFTVDMLTTGEVGDMENGPIATAVGVTYFNEKLKQLADSKSVSGKVIGGAGSKDSGSRDVQSIFAEFNFPLPSKVEVNVAARVDRYSDFGTTTNPKVSAKWGVTDKMLLRASAGTGFKAPTLQELYSASSNGFQTFIDRYACANAGGTACQYNQYKVSSSGNRDLKEEKAITAGLGMVYEPSNTFSTSVDLWYTKISNGVGIDFEDLTIAELNGVNPETYGVKTNRSASGRLQQASPISAPNLNLQGEEISGVDLNFTGLILDNFIGHKLSYDEDLAYMLFYKREGFPGAGLRNRLGEWGTPNWKNTLSFTAARNSMAYTLGIRSLPGTGLIDRTKSEKTNSSNELDLTLSYVHSKTASFRVGIRNILDTEPPNDPTGGSGGAPEVDDSLYDVNGRIVFAGYSQKF